VINVVEWNVSEGKLRRLLELISSVVGYEFDDADWDAVSYGVRTETTGYEYILFGESATRVQFRRAGDAIHVAAASDPEVELYLQEIAYQSDDEVIARTYSVFAAAPRPDHFTNHRHCEECKDYDDFWLPITRESLSADDIGDCWTAVTFLQPEGFRYVLPALVRLALEDEWDSAFDEILGRLSIDDQYALGQSATLTLDEDEAVLAFLRHAGYWRKDLVEGALVSPEELERVTTAWANRIARRRIAAAHPL
jgi:hypothetical protein